MGELNMCVVRSRSVHGGYVGNKTLDLCDSYSYVLTPRAAGRLIPCMSHVCMLEEHRVYVLRFGMFSGARIVSNVL
jgi:hypothetical protein